jgi:hypothetical protein
MQNQGIQLSKALRKVNLEKNRHLCYTLKNKEFSLKEFFIFICLIII